MKNFLSVLLILSFFLPKISSGQGEPFSKSVINERSTPPYRLQHPFEIIYGPDDHLYITEKTGRVLRVDPVTGNRQILLDYRSKVYLTIDRVAGSIGQNGMLGMALHPNFGKGTGEDSIFVAYSYSASAIRISRFLYNSAGPSLTNETVLLEGIPASNDHSTGRMIIGLDGYLYYSCGDQGANQWGYKCNPNLAQDLPTNAEITVANYSKYAGKILRISRDGGIPADNPFLGGVRSHIYTMGHRNPQGLVWQKNPSNGNQYPQMTPGGKLFSSEHGPRTDDEINIIQAGKNYGWPYIAGYLDDINYQYVNWSSSPNCASTPYNDAAIPAGATILQETDVSIPNFQPPMSTMFTACAPLPSSVCDASGSNWMKYPTIAPSSIDFYCVNTKIPNWYPSLLIPTLRRGVLYRYKLNASMDGLVTDSIPYFRTQNRYRDIAISNDGLRIYLITDSLGTTSGPSGTGTSVLTDRGAIIEYLYTGTLSLKDNPEDISKVPAASVSVYPNPATDRLNIDLGGAPGTRAVYYQLIDMSGRLLLSGKAVQRNFSIDVRRYSKGIIMLKLVDDNGIPITNEKILIQ